ncbi:hypothetical protein HCN44_002522 [Aphidius gifuensis]|uniref:Odorant-binding protein n=1 Tax=Aphidius gifuensis TaxID=684658 RepID=A0A834Y2L5_APHGI|nr:hypothetical protein HCN44_002522 [Aphidius gifuensis]
MQLQQLKKIEINVMNSVNRAKDRLKKYPALLAECRESAITYAKCVIKKSNVNKNDCQNEFIKFKKCLLDAAVKNKTKL